MDLQDTLRRLRENRLNAVTQAQGRAVPTLQFACGYCGAREGVPCVGSCLGVGTRGPTRTPSPAKGWTDSAYSEHEGSVVALIADQDERTGNAYWHELQYPDGAGGNVPPLLVLCVQVACECGWRSPRIRAPRGVVWVPWTVTIASPLQEQRMRALWRSHLEGSAELAIVPIWENERGAI